MGAQFEILVADADESSDITDPELLTRELARRKANAALEILRSRGEADGAIYNYSGYFTYIAVSFNDRLYQLISKLCPSPSAYSGWSREQYQCHYVFHLQRSFLQ